MAYMLSSLLPMPVILAAETLLPLQYKHERTG